MNFEETVTDRSYKSFGPFHPAINGPYILDLELDGERVLKAKIERGFTHRALEKSMELHSWHSAGIYASRVDPEASVFAELAFSLAVEEMAFMSAPPRGQAVRLILCELNRMSAHLLTVAKVSRTVGADTIFHYVLRDREKILDLIELLTGARFCTGFLCFGGVRQDVTAGFVERALETCEQTRLRIKEYNDLFSFNHTFKLRTVGVGKVDPEWISEFGLSGPVARSAGAENDVRKDLPYSGYDLLEFRVPTTNTGDTHGRFLLRLNEVLSSIEIIQNICETLPVGEFNRGSIDKGFKPPAGEAFVRVETQRGQLSCHVVSSGLRNPTRVQFCTPSQQVLQALPLILSGAHLEDLSLILNGLDFCIGEVDR